MNKLENEIYETLFKIESENEGSIVGQRGGDIAKLANDMPIYHSMIEMVDAIMRGEELSIKDIDETEIAYLFAQDGKLVNMSQIAEETGKKAMEVQQKVAEEINDLFNERMAEHAKKVTEELNELYAKRVKEELAKIKNVAIIDLSEDMPEQPF